MTGAFPTSPKRQANKGVSFLILFLFLLLSCRLPERAGGWFSTPTFTPTATATHTLTPTASSTYTLTPTASRTPTLTPTPSPTPLLTPTDTPTATSIPPTLTPGPNQITAGEDVWNLTSAVLTDKIYALGFRVSMPWTYYSSPSVFLQLNFECTTGRSLIDLYTERKMGLNFVYEAAGYDDIYLSDTQGRRHPVVMLGNCWLAAVLPNQQAGTFTLHFRRLPPFTLQVLPQGSLAQGPIVFTSEVDGQPEIYSLDPESGSQRRLTDHPANDYEPVWSPDKQRVAFVSTRAGDPDIFIMDADGKNLGDISNNPAEDGGPAWSPDGRALAFHSLRSGDWDVYVMDASGANPRNLTHDTAYDLYPAWSPDGQRIAFYSNRDGNWEIYVVNTDGTDLRRLTNHPDEDLLPAWSPDGQRIAFWSRRNGLWRIFIMNADGSQPYPLQLFANPGSRLSRPTWSPDGSLILFVIVRDGSQELYVMNVDGSDPRRLTRGLADDYDPDW